ncbi:serine hydrolase [Sphingobium sp. DEHP117]|uniref:serine hydrolase domain-containing protein n=1 Tax=Sphingobium sp. DEHP117 TaxID=2993436 RepID=UPI0027D4AC88|nr:serine hydrolase [Sphingobium sp. DEHP117]MDQ4420993.1 serine hydrolase [Sphingobium sp. DEHP117]
MTAGSAIHIHGFCDDIFKNVREEFAANFEERGELGASLAIYLDGKLVVDLWGGIADTSTGCPWEESTMAVVFSATKGMAAICMHMLADQGLLEFDKPVAAYWPEFAANGKENITVAMALSHQAGVPVWQLQDLPSGAFNDFDFVSRLLAAETPVWEPGTAHGYHAVSIGVIEGELVKRITGRSIGTFLREEVARPLGADVWIGLPEAEESRVSTSYLSDGNPQSPLTQKLNSDPGWIGWKLITNGGDDLAYTNSRERHAAEIPASGGIASAKGLARLYAPLSLDGSIDNVRLVQPQSLHAMGAIRSASDCDLILRIPTTFTLGFSKSWGDRRLGSGEYMILGQNAFGTPGMGGSMGFADTEARMSFGYVMNKHGSGVGLNERGQSLIDAAYRALGFSSSAPGFWVR